MNYIKYVVAMPIIPNVRPDFKLDLKELWTKNLEIQKPNVVDIRAF